MFSSAQRHGGVYRIHTDSVPSQVKPKVVAKSHTRINLGFWQHQDPVAEGSAARGEQIDTDVDGGIVVPQLRKVGTGGAGSSAIRRPPRSEGVLAPRTQGVAGDA